jgi:acyl-CoA thioester hydrolase
MAKFLGMYKYTITPKFGDIDGLGHVNNTVIPGWFEEARNEIYRYFNPDLSLKTWNLILVHIEVDFIYQIFYNNNVEIRTYISDIGKSSFQVYQEAWQNGKLCSKGKTVLVHFNFEHQKSEMIPGLIKSKLEVHLAQ